MVVRWLADQWTLWSDIGGGVGFCVWILQTDGLRVAPFTHHPEGSGELRALGLTAAGWRTWYTAVVGGSPPRTSPPPPEEEVAIHSGLSYLAWTGPGAIGAALAIVSAI